MAARAAVSYAGEVAALRAAATVKSQLRRALTARSLRLGPGLAGRSAGGEIATLGTRGLDGLDSYFARYLPQLVLAVVVPIAVLARVAAADWVSAVVIAVTLPLIPVFAVLVGWHTKAQTRRQWRLLATLGGHFLDVVEGLPTLKVFGRARAQEEVIAKVTDDYRTATMSTLRVAFLSALVLELAAAIATALVAVEVGLRLLYGHLGYETALLVLLLTPEAYPAAAGGRRPVPREHGRRRRGHARLRDPGYPGARPAAAAARRCRRSRHARADLRTEEIRLNGVTVAYPGRARPALDGVSLTIAPGERIVLTGPSGAGKSTLLALLLRFIAPAAGTITVGGRDLAALGRTRGARRSPGCRSSPTCSRGSVADNIALGQPGASPRRHLPGRPAGRRRGLHRGTAGRIRHAARGARAAAVGGPAAADRAGPRVPAGRAPAAPGRARRSSGSGQRPADRDGHRHRTGRPHRDPGQPRPGLGWRRLPGHQPGPREADGASPCRLASRPDGAAVTR